MSGQSLGIYWATVLVWFAGLSSVCEAQTDQYAKLADQLSDIIRNEIEEKNIPAFSIALIDDQKVVFSAGFGNEKRGTPNG